MSIATFTHTINNGIKTFLPKQTIPMAVRYAGDNLQSWTKKKERNQANMINLSEDVSCPNNCIVHKRIEPKYLLPSMELLVSS